MEEFAGTEKFPLCQEYSTTHLQGCTGGSSERKGAMFSCAGALAQVKYHLHPLHANITLMFSLANIVVPAGYNRDRKLGHCMGR